MALTVGSIITAADFNNLKTRVNNEMKRRSYTGSLSSYNTSVSVSIGSRATAAQANSIINGIRAINASGITSAVSYGSSIQALNAASDKLADYASRSLVGTNSGCASSCSGLCQGCNNTCTGSCTGTCTGSCTGSCTNTCKNTCTGSCSGTCTGTCSGSCTNCNGCSGCDGCSGCGSGCAGGCWGCGGQCSGHSCGWKGL